MWNPIILDVFVECVVCKKTLQKLQHDPSEVSKIMGKIANANRRSRTPNWSVEEKQYLLELIKDRKEVVIPKSNSGPLYSEEKDTAWNEILRALAVKYGNKFVSITTKKVKTQWQNMKRIARDEIAIHGVSVHKYSPQSLEVCNILELVKDGVLKPEHEILNNTNNNTITTDVVVKAEPVDEDTYQLSGSGLGEPMETSVSQQHESTSHIHHISETVQQESSVISSNSEQDDSRIYEQEGETSSPLQCRNNLTNAPIMMESSLVDDANNLKYFQRDVQDFLKYTSIEKRLRMETLKEERQTARAMRETAELNKIIAEQKLKHVLWVKKNEMAMYSGEPGSGAGRGGGGGGTIRQAGGAFGKMEAAREDEYFYKKQQEQLRQMKEHLDKEISFHQDQIKRHEDAIRRHKDQASQMKE